MKALRSLLLGVGSSAVWPIYLVLLAYTIRQAPWPRDAAVLLSSVVFMLSVVGLAANLVQWVLGSGGVAETILAIPPPVCRDLKRSVLVLLLSGGVLLVPSWLLDWGFVAPSGRPIAIPIIEHVLMLFFEVIAWVVTFRLVRGGSALCAWLPDLPEQLAWIHERRRLIAGALLTVLGSVIVLDARGYSFTTHRLLLGALQTQIVLVICWGVYRALLRAIDDQAWRWIRIRRHAAEPATTNDPNHPDDLAERLRRLSAYLVPIFGVFLVAWVWNVDLAFFQFLAKLPVFSIDKGPDPVNVGDLTKAALILGVSVAIWRHMSTLFELTLFPRMPDDPGVRFAVVTLCRYVVLGIGLCAALASIQLGLQKISVVLAALGVGLGFGLQEIVSNFVCGIILLLERPIQIGDIVTVAGMSGRVDRINIRATTIINPDNQSMIVPNREFITGNLVNWTHKDKVVRVPIRVAVAYGTDPERVVELLLLLAREDPDVLRNPVPVAILEGFRDACLDFGFYVFVPNPSLSGRVRHRLCAQIQSRFETEDIPIAYPTHELHLRSVPDDSALKHAQPPTQLRVDVGSSAPPDPKLTVPAGVEPKYCGVDD